MDVTTILRNTILLFSILGLAACDAQTDASRDSATNARPNIILIMPDDHAVRAISAYDGSINQTPNIDRIGREGAIFWNAFVGNSICGPSRSTILTGKHSHRHGVVGNASPWDGSQTLMPRLMQEAGYTTALIGKWHLNGPPGDEFDYSYWLIGAGLQGFYYNPEFISNTGDTLTIEGHATDIVTDLALDWLESNGTDADDPFMMFVHYKAPHVPRMPEFRFLDRYVDETIPEPETLFDDYATRLPHAAEASMGFMYRPLPPLEEHDPSANIYFDRMTPEQLERWHQFKDPEAEQYNELIASGDVDDDELLRFSYQKFIKDYIRIVDGVDENVGRILTWLDDHPEVSDNTIVLYISDQGYFTGEHRWAEKRFMYEESIRFPLLVRWPAAGGNGARIDAMVHNTDIAPTLLDAAGIAVPDEMQGRSFVSLLDGETPGDWRRAVYYHYYDHGLHNVPRHDGVRTNRYKLINFYTNDEWEFYDLEADSFEVNNLYEDPGYAEVIEEHRSELVRLRQEFEVPEHHYREPFVRAGPDQRL